MSNRAKTAVLVFGVIFLLFYWTHMAFISAEKNVEASTAAAQAKTDKAMELYAQASMTSAGQGPVDTGLLTFIETTARRTGLFERMTEMKPKQTGAAEAASVHLDSLTNDEVTEFIRLIESRPNIKITYVSIKKRFDNEKRLNLVLDAEKS